ncbi:carboxymuconolactone decarboxylase family protein [Streptomyces sp. NBC_01390]|uniref:carboxymuconolactone decarboxylase family protein n=1 Tax=Streptomyces sp. NBC_01390 TaxID=2903850 RepID=UPI0032556830
MGLAELKSALPDYAADLRLNLEKVVGGSRLTEQQLWGTVLVCAIASRSPRVLRELGREARARLSPEAYTAARATAAEMAMSNVFHRTRHLLSDPEYGRLRAGLRANVLGDPGVGRTDVELWSVAVSAINACGACLDAHERVLRAAGVDRETVQEAFRIAAVVQAVATTLDAEAILSE